MADGEAWLAFQASGPAGYGIYLVRPDGTGFHAPIAGVGSGTQLHPDWSPDGSSLTFDMEESGDVWLVRVDGWEPERLVDCEAPCAWASEAAWAPDGASVAFQRYAEVDGKTVSALEVLDITTREVRTVLSAPEGLVMFAPRWSPDGRSVVVEVARFEGGTPRGQIVGDSLGVIDLTAAMPEIRTIVPFEWFANNPDWSPTGALLVFSAPSAGGEPGGAKSDLWTVNPDGSGLTRLTDVAASGGTAIHPAFAPDGEGVLFVLTDPASGAFDAMATIGLDGTGLAPATSSGYTPGTHPRLRPTP